MKYAIVTFGCRANQADSFSLDGDLRTLGGQEAAARDADLVVVNTCSVTAAADQAARQTIRRIARANPAARILATGCYATRRPADLAALPGVVDVIGNEDKPQLASTLHSSHGAVAMRGLDDARRARAVPAGPGALGRTIFPLSVQTGCDERCSYCVIPFTRGPSRSRALPEIVDEVDRAARAGFKQLLLTGVHLGSWGRDLRPAGSLAELLRALESSRHELLFRLSSIEPMDCTREVIDVIAGSGRFAPHFHLPVQHGSSRVLRAMNRPYASDVFQRLVERIRTRLPGAAIGTDLIAGFPGEEDDDFARCVDLLEHCPLSYVHVFPYSDRPGTAAAAMRPKVPGATIRARADMLRERGRALMRRFEAAQAGQVRRGLTLEDGTLVLTDNFLKVRIPPGHARNEWVDVRISAVQSGLIGTPL